MARNTEQLGDQIIRLIDRMGELKYPDSCSCRTAYALGCLQSHFRAVMICETHKQEATLREIIRVLEQQISVLEKL